MPTVLISGANRGLGLALTRSYLEDGWRVLACARKLSDDLSDVLSRAGNHEFFQLDVSKHDDIEGLARRIQEPLDVLLNNAGRFGKVNFPEGGIQDQAFGVTDFDDWAQTFRVNVMGPMKLSECLVDQVAASEQRKIVTFTSMVGSSKYNTTGGIYAYRTSKAAVNMMMLSMAIDLAPRGILAAAMHPGWARTDMGGANAEIDVPTAVRGIREVIREMDQDKLGQILVYDGSTMPY